MDGPLHIMNLLHNKQAPTKSQVERDRNRYSQMESLCAKGGKIEYAFDVARVKCFGITYGNFREQPKGPYHHNFDDDNDDDY